jgi:hypothetical protein
MLQLDSIRKSVAFREEDLELMLVVGMQDKIFDPSLCTQS